MTLTPPRRSHLLEEGCGGGVDVLPENGGLRESCRVESNDSESLLSLRVFAWVVERPYGEPQEPPLPSHKVCGLQTPPRRPPQPDPTGASPCF